VPGAPNDPDLWAVHDGKIYLFATPGCVAQFEADPESFL
jgi:YHS domain-containing protein